jgi:omega-amidase
MGNARSKRDSASLRIGLGFDHTILLGSRSVASLQNLDLLLFPELVDGGYAALANGAGRHLLNDAFLRRFRDASARYALCCVAGSVCLEHKRSECTNTSLVFTRGRMVHQYDKIHLFRPTGDRRYFTPGRTIRTFTVSHASGVVRAGVIVCYDLRFPELTRKLSKQGMQLLLVPARWPRARDDAWFTLLKARAIENQIFVVGCNALGEEGGYSYVFDPGGNLLCSNKPSDSRVLRRCVLDLRALRGSRILHNNLRDAVLLKK